MNFRRDIQGLRGVAVLFVVLYHAGIGFSSGYIGVDVFFVISGFLIAQSIEARTGHANFEFFSFIIQRVRRLAPTFLAVLITTCILAILVLEPGSAIREVYETSIFSIFSAANFKLMFLNSYDDLTDNPLRHLWSLGIEEQFYATLAFILILIKYQRSRLKQFSFRYQKWLKVLLITSFVIGLTMQYGTLFLLYLMNLERFNTFGEEWSHRLAYFFPFFRSWEILIGLSLGFGFFSGPNLSKTYTQWLRVISLVAVVFAAWLIPSSATFPGLIVLFPVLATAVILMYPETDLVNRILNQSWLVWIGNMSYALYLWHWPILVYTRRVFTSILIPTFISLLLSFLLAFISTQIIERRYRFYDRSLKKLIAPLIFSVLVCFCGFQLSNSRYWATLIPTIEPSTANAATRLKCDSSKPGWESECVFGSVLNGPTVYLFGDSNARSASDGVLEAGRIGGWLVTVGVQGACPVTFSTIQTSPRCNLINDERLKLVRENRPNLLIIVNNWTNYFIAPQGTFGSYKTIDSQLRALKETLQVLHDLKVPTLIQEQAPVCEFSHNLLNYVLLPRLGLGGAQTCGDFNGLNTTRTLFATRIRAIIAEKPHLFRLVSLRDVLCEETCSPFRSGVNMYSDPSHISPSASLLSAPVLLNAAAPLLTNN